MLKNGLHRMEGLSKDAGPFKMEMCADCGTLRISPGPESRYFHERRWLYFAPVFDVRDYA
jgi:hypothetical protein